MIVNECNCKVDESLLIKLIENKCIELGKPFKPPYRITAVAGGYARICIAHEWIRVHRLIGEYLFDEIKNKHIHHKDEDKLNNQIENLELLSPSKHAKKTAAHKYVSREHKKSFGDRMAEKIKRHDVTREKVIELREFGMTYGEIASKLNCGYNTVWRKLSEK